MEKSLCVLHDEAIRKAVSAEKPARKFAKLLQFLQSVRPQQPAKRPSLTTSCKSSGHPSFSGSSGFKAASSSSLLG